MSIFCKALIFAGKVGVSVHVSELDRKIDSILFVKAASFDLIVSRLSQKIGMTVFAVLMGKCFFFV